MNYIIFDLEYNQPSTLNKRLSVTMETGRPNFLKFEILQIGAIKLNDNLKYVSNFKMYVKPKFMPTIAKHVLEILNVKERYIRTNGLYFDRVFHEFKNFIGTDKCTFVTWSNSDVEVLRSNLDAWNIQFDTSKYRHIDLQQIIMQMQGLELRPSLEKIANEYEITYNLVHDAYADASVTKQLFQKMGICESKPYVDNINFNLNKKIRKHSFNEILTSEVDKAPHCTNCGKFSKIDIKTNFYTSQRKDALYMKKMYHCDKCNLYSLKNYKYDLEERTLFIEDNTIQNDNLQHLNKVKEELDLIKQIENIQLNMK